MMEVAGRSVVSSLLVREEKNRVQGPLNDTHCILHKESQLGSNHAADPCRGRAWSRIRQDRWIFFEWQRGLGQQPLPAYVVGVRVRSMRQPAWPRIGKRSTVSYAAQSTVFYMMICPLAVTNHS